MLSEVVQREAELKMVNENSHVENKDDENASEVLGVISISWKDMGIKGG